MAEQYPIPQFIEQEGKIAFFISFRQFFYLLGAGVTCFFLYFVLPKTLFYIVAFIVFIAAASLAFIKMNGEPLLNIMFEAMEFSVHGN
ncbi:MAG: PrgI family protein [Candidatus Staskawiczbacteria bacterium]|nr:PrgI family protein [Candidatus Staskawiczbacteria bacterium]